MITCHVEHLPKEQETLLRLWLGKAEYSMLVKVVECKMKKHATSALKDALQGDSSNLKFDGANASLRSAQMYADCLDILKQIVAQPVGTPFETAKLV